MNNSEFSENNHESGEFHWTDEHLHEIRKRPHLLGHIVGKDKLTDQHSIWIRQTWEPQRHTQIQAHRGAYKTTAITEIGIIWWLLFHPNDRVGLIRKSFTDAADTLEAIKLYMSQPGMISLFTYAHGVAPKQVKKPYGAVLFSFKSTITKELSIEASGVDQSITGTHYDVIITDDIIAVTDRYSKAVREKTKNSLREIMTNIIDPGKYVRNVGTPWHKEDAWSILPEAVKYTVYDTGILSEKEIEEKRSTTTKSLFAANYELEHAVAEEAMLKDPKFKNWIYGIGRPVAHLDAKFSGDHYNALTIMSKDKNGDVQAIGWVSQLHSKDWMDFIKKKCKQYGVKKIYNETNPDKGYTAELLAKRCPITGYKIPNVSTYSESMNKHRKITSYLPEYWGKIYWDTSMDPNKNTTLDINGDFSPEVQYMNMCTDYMEGEEPDDAPDSAASLLRDEFWEKEKSEAKSSALNQW